MAPLVWLHLLGFVRRQMGDADATSRLGLQEAFDDQLPERLPHDHLADAKTGRDRVLPQALASRQGAMKDSFAERGGHDRRCGSAFDGFV